MSQQSRTNLTRPVPGPMGAFDDEKVDMRIDGELQERPRTKWS